MAPIIFLGYLVIFIVIVTILSAIHQKFKHKNCASTKRLDGKTALVTGGTAGMGLEIATELARRGARVVVACPFPEEGSAAREHIVRATRNHDVHFQLLDLASLASTRRFAAEILAREPRLDLLVNNAGVGGPFNTTTCDGINSVMQINYFGPVLLTILLLPLLKKSSQHGEPSRIVNVASAFHIIGKVNISRLSENYYSLYKGQAYPNSKLCLVMFTRELAKKLRGEDVVVNSLEPGTVGTRIYDTWNCRVGFLVTWIIGWVCKTPWQGAQTTLHVALDDTAGTVSGEYFMECRVSKAGGSAYDEDLSARLWEKSLRIVKLSPEELGAGGLSV